MTTPTKPLPAPDPATTEYWEAAKRGELRLPKCSDCGKLHFYPKTLCPHCGSTRLEWARASGNGEVYSFTVVHRAPSPAFEGDVPYVVAVIALEEGPHMMSSVVGVAPDQVRVGQKVRVKFRPTEGSDVMLPVFEVEPD
jgi:uncharacterized OB-fold protein